MKVHIEDLRDENGEIKGSLYLESDDLCFIVREYTGAKDKNGREIPKIHGYFSSIASAIRHIVKMQIKSSTAETLYELLQDVSRIERTILSKINA